MAQLLPPYGSAAHLYVNAGWPGVLPVPDGTKYPPPVGFTGETGRDTTPPDVAVWVAQNAADSIALRCSHGIVGIDVDAYLKGDRVKQGDQTLATCEAVWGPLPATWRSSARGPGASGIRFFRAPAQRYRTVLQPDIEIIQHHHRYAVVWPSLHHDVAAQYQWYRPDGSITVDGEVPRPEDLAVLPDSWVLGLSEGASAPGVSSASWAAGEALMAEIMADDRPACAELQNAADSAMRELDNPEVGTRHDAMIGKVFRFIMAAAMGHPGASQYLPVLRQRWLALTQGEAREAEFDRMISTAARKGVTSLNGMPRPEQDPCVLGDLGLARYSGREVAPEPVQYSPDHAAREAQRQEPAQVPRGGVSTGWAEPVPTVQGVGASPPGDGPALASPGEGSGPPRASGGEARPRVVLDPVEGQPTEVPRTSGWVEWIGAGLFDPPFDNDQDLAGIVLDRVQTATRPVTDAGGWITREDAAWRLHKRADIPSRAVAECVGRMPEGDSTPVTPGVPATPAQRTWKRRMRLKTSAGASGVAKMVKTLVAGGRHPLAVDLSDLDVDPQVFWAGGMPYDLSRSQDYPWPADWIDPGTPHLQGTRVVPLLTATPAWDAFLAAVWPDPEIRAYAMRVLSTGLTGLSPRIAPVLFGERGRGKTQVVEILAGLIGTYGEPAGDARLLASARGMTPGHVVAGLIGKRLVFVDETPPSQGAALESFKALTGGGSVTGDAKYADSVTFGATWTLVTASNHEPAVGDPAVADRLRLLPCDGDPEVVRRARQELGRVLAQERPGILGMMMTEAGRFWEDQDSAGKLAAPRVLRELELNLVTDQDSVGYWLAEETLPSDNGTRSRTLYESYREWCQRGGLKPEAETAWGRVLSDAGYPWFRDKHGKKRPLILNQGELPHGLPVPQPRAENVYTTDMTGFPVHSNYAPGAQSVPDPASINTPRSDDVSGVSGVQMYGSEEVLRDHKNEGEYYRSRNGGEPNTVHLYTGNTGEPGPTTRNNTGAQLKGDPAPTVHPSPTVHPPEKPTESLRRKDKATLTPEEKAERARERKAKLVTEREEARRTAVRAAEGGTHQLPVLVDRALSITEVSPGQAFSFLATLATPALTVDVEHTGYPVGHRLYALRLVQLGTGQACVVFDPADPHQLSVIQAVLDIHQAWHAHSGTADLVPLAWAGVIDYRSGLARLHDTVITTRSADPQQYGTSDPDLKNLAPAVLGEAAVIPVANLVRQAVWDAGRWLTDTEVETPLERSGWAQITPNSTAMIRYAAADVLDTGAIATMVPPPAPEVYERERTAQRMTARVAFEGIALDREVIAAKTAEHLAGQSEWAERITGYGLTPGSNKELATTLTSWGVALPHTKPSGKFPMGQPTVKEGVISRFRDAPDAVGDLVRSVLAYREHTTALGTFLRPYQVLCADGDGRARPTVYTMGANTGRMSCVRPNFQQLPRQGGMRQCVRADDGQRGVAADFSGIEIRMAAALSQDPVMCQMILDGVDLHGVIAALVFGPEWTKANRYTVKPMVFGDMYGAGIETMAEQGGCAPELAQAAKDAISGQFPTYRRWAEDVKRAVRNGHTQFTSYSGRVIHLDKAFPHKAPNYLIQGSAREVLIDALVAWERTPWGSYRLIPVHDELDVFVPEAEAEAATEALVACMTTELYGVPITAEADTPWINWPDAT